MNNTAASNVIKRAVAYVLEVIPAANHVRSIVVNVHTLFKMWNYRVGI